MSKPRTKERSCVSSTRSDNGDLPAPDANCIRLCASHIAGKYPGSRSLLFERASHVANVQAPWKSAKVVVHSSSLPTVIGGSLV